MFKKWFLFLILLALLSACRNPPQRRTYYPEIERTIQDEWIFPFLKSHDYDYNFALFDQLIQQVKDSQWEVLNLVLLDYINSHKEDPYLAYYLMRIAHYYEQNDGQEVAKLYLYRIIHNTQDLQVAEQSVHLTALNLLLQLSSSEEERTAIYEKLINQFPNKINLGQCHYYLGRSYERLGYWDRAYDEYNAFLQYPNTEIPGLVNGYDLIRRKLAFHSSAKDWTFETRDDLVRSIKYAISSGKIYLLNQYISDDFFVLSWSQKMVDQHYTSVMGDFTSYSQSPITYNRDLEPFSNDQEAYLKTWGWSYRVKSWYLYFRKIDYPRDPEINGRWEWAGIYLGDPL